MSAKFRWLGRPPIYAAPILDLRVRSTTAAAAGAGDPLAHLHDRRHAGERRPQGRHGSWPTPDPRAPATSTSASPGVTDTARDRAGLEHAAAGRDFATVGVGGDFGKPLRVDRQNVDSLAKDQERLLPLAGVMFIVILLVLFGHGRAARCSACSRRRSAWAGRWLRHGAGRRRR